jgi:hypothetical protein
MMSDAQIEIKPVKQQILGLVCCATQPRLPLVCDP